MARKQTKRAASGGEIERVPAILSEIASKALANRQPTLGRNGEHDAYLRVLELLGPSSVAVRDSTGKLREIWREPMLTLFWSAGSGAWQWQITDRTLGVQVKGYLPSLVDLMQQIDAQIAMGTVEIKSLK